MKVAFTGALCSFGSSCTYERRSFSEVQGGCRHWLTCVPSRMGRKVSRPFYAPAEIHYGDRSLISERLFSTHPSARTRFKPKNERIPHCCFACDPPEWIAYFIFRGVNVFYDTCMRSREIRFAAVTFVDGFISSSALNPQGIEFNTSLQRCLLRKCSFRIADYEIRRSIYMLEVYTSKYFLTTNQGSWYRYPSRRTCCTGRTTTSATLRAPRR